MIISAWLYVSHSVALAHSFFLFFPHLVLCHSLHREAGRSVSKPESRGFRTLHVRPGFSWQATGPWNLSPLDLFITKWSQSGQVRERPHRLERWSRSFCSGCPGRASPGLLCSCSVLCDRLGQCRQWRATASSTASCFCWVAPDHNTCRVPLLLAVDI